LPVFDMPESAFDRLFGAHHAFDSPFVLWASVGIAVVLVLSIVVTKVLASLKKIDAKTSAEIVQRWRSWVLLTALMLGPILLGAAWVMLAVLVLSLLCYREYARVTGLFREKTISAVVVLGISMVTFAVFDHYDRLFFACAVLTSGLIAVVTIPQDRPKGYIQRVALGVLGFVLFGYSLGYLGFIGNDRDYRPILVLLLLSLEMNDLIAYLAGTSIGGPKLLPATSPNKTVAGSLGALVLTTALVAVLGHIIFHGSAVDRIDRLVVLGLLVSVLGQLGELMLSSIKRDVQVKETGAVIPGHGGLLDRFDRLVLVPPAVFHYLSLYNGPLGSGEVQRILTGP
jgi:phosphatidate cytidylyltransferase